MSVRLAALVLIVVAVFAPRAHGQELTAEEKAFFRERLSDVVEVVPERVTDEAVRKVFAPAIYHVQVLVKEPGGSTSTQALVARFDNELAIVTRPSTDGDAPQVQKMFKRDFKLANDAAAALVQQAFDAVFPIARADEKARAFRRKGNQWTFVRGEFFDSKQGFVLTTDAAGALTSVKYVLKLP
jgi:hypothetical protein